MPNDWKCARVTPKEGYKMNPNNYRPISVISVILKVFEKVILHQMYEYLTTHNLLYNLQSGFRTLHSTLTALLDATDQWYTNMDNALMHGILFIDLKKAFDTIDHNILLKELSCHGFSLTYADKVYNQVFSGYEQRLKYLKKLAGC